MVNIGFVSLALRYGAHATDTETVLEILSSKIGLVLVVLGAMHFLNLMNLPVTPAGTAPAVPPVLPKLALLKRAGSGLNAPSQLRPVASRRLQDGNLDG